MEIITYPHPTLRHTAKPICRVDRELRAIVDKMFELMYEAKGIGLAANQVDLPLRLFIVNLEAKQGEGEELVFINPVISHAKGSAQQEEGCLSLPGLCGDVARPKTVRINAFTLDGRELLIDATGMLARVVQHEFDHLNGVLFIDRLSDAKQKELRAELSEFEISHESRRSTGSILSDAEIANRLADWESKYCK